MGWDFNEILFESEKLGGQSRNLSQMKDFSEALDGSGLQDIPFKGDHFTWCNKRKGNYMILARLDRFVSNFDWHMFLPSAEVENLAYFGSDHRPMSVVLKSIFLPKIMKYPKRFTFEHKWIIEEDFSEYIKKSWADGRDQVSIPAGLSQCNGNLKV